VLLADDPGAHIGDATSRERPTRSGLGSASSCFAKLGAGRRRLAASQRPLAGSNNGRWLDRTKHLLMSWLPWRSKTST
jgi:hypothetical protein